MPSPGRACPAAPTTPRPLDPSRKNVNRSHASYQCASPRRRAVRPRGGWPVSRHDARQPHLHPLYVGPLSRRPGTSGGGSLPRETDNCVPAEPVLSCSAGADPELVDTCCVETFGGLVVSSAPIARGTARQVG